MMAHHGHQEHQCQLQEVEWQTLERQLRANWIAGGNPSATNATEEWTNETTSLNVKTLTQS